MSVIRRRLPGCYVRILAPGSGSVFSGSSPVRGSVWVKNIIGPQHPKAKMIGKRIWIIQEVSAGPCVLAICWTNILYWQCIALVADLITNTSRIYSTHLFGNTNCFLVGYMHTLSFRKMSDVIDVLDYPRDFLTTDPGEKVYALLGLPSFAEQCHPLDADYTKPKLQVFLRFTEAVVRNSNSLAILSHV